MDYKIIEFESHGDENGQLVALENGKDIPFDIRRVYYIFDTTQEAIRGKHSHPELEQLLFCPKGSCDFIIDDGRTCETVRLDSPTKAIYIYGDLWREFTNFSDDCVVVVLADKLYKDTIYVRDYDEFKRSAK